MNKNDNRWNGKGYDGKNNIVYELKNGNGYIKEYDGWKLKFEGGYLNGQKNGRGKKCNNYGKLIYEGEYLNGKRYSFHSPCFWPFKYSPSEPNLKKFIFFNMSITIY